MRLALSIAAAAAAIALATSAGAQTDAQTGAPTTAAPRPHHHHAHAQASSQDAAGDSAGTSGDHYSGVDTDMKRENVKAPYGGHNQAQADAKEAPITERLNEQQLSGGGPR